MKMISSTSSTSMSGVTLMFALWPPLGPTAIPMIVLLLTAYCMPLLPCGGGWRWRSARSGLLLLGEQTQIIHTGGPDSIHNLHYAAEVGAHVRFHVHGLARLVGQTVFHCGGQGIDVGLVAAEVDCAVPRHRNQKGVFLVGILH